MKATHLGLAVLVALAAMPALAQGDCLDFPSSSDYHDESWFKAKDLALDDLMKGAKPPREDIEAAIIKLRQAIGKNSTSSARSRETTTGRQFPYFPYVALAILEAEVGNVACIEPLLARESRSLPADFKAQFDRLNNYAVAVASSKTYVELSTRVRSLEAKGQLSAAAASKSQEIVSLGGQLGSAGPDDLARLTSAISKSITDLASIEAKRGRDAIEMVRAATPAAVDGAAASACSDPTATTNPQQLQQVVAQVDRCYAAGVQALNAGGRSACSSLTTERRKIRDRLSQLQTLGGSGPGPADLPAACAQGDAAWAGNDLDDLSRKFAALDFGATRTAYASQLSTIRNEINRSMGDFRAGLQAHTDGIVPASSTCERILILGSANGSLRQLKQTIDGALNNPDLVPTPELRNIGDEVSRAKTRFATKLGAAVDDLLAQKQSMADEGQDVSPFDALQATRGQIGSTGVTQQALTAVCNAARGADDVITEWGKNNTDKVWAKARAHRWFLTNAGYLKEAAGVECVGASLAALPQRMPSRPDVDWVKKTRADVSVATQCLEVFRESRMLVIDSVESELSGSVAALSSLDGVAGLPKDKLEQMRVELERSLAGLKGAKSVLTLQDGSDEAALRAALQQAGVEAPAGSWKQLSELIDNDKPAGLKSIGELSTAEVVVDATDTAARWSGKIGKLGAFAALDGALTRFAGGDVDRAIQDLRGWNADSVTDSETAALRHATLSFFLHTKWTLLPEDKRQQAVGALLYADASQEAQAAFRNDPDLRLPRALNDESFQQFVANCCM